MHLTEFEGLVSRAVQDLPEEFREHLANVNILIEDWPDSEILAEAECDNASELLGYYRGVPLVDRSEAMAFEVPDEIFLFRRPILEQCGTEREIRRCIRETLQHEIAHHFGFDDDQLEEMGVY